MTPELRFDRLLEFFEKKEKKEKKGKRKEKVKVKKKKEEKVEEPLSVVEVEKPVEIKLRGKKEEEKAEREFLVFSSEKEYYALPLKRVKEIYPSLNLITPPGFPEYILGFVKYKGRIVPVVDIFSILEVNPSEVKNYVVLEIEKRPLFLLIGKIEGIAKEREDNVFEVPFNLDKDMFLKLIYENGKLIGCINPDYFARINKEIFEKIKKTQ